MALSHRAEVLLKTLIERYIAEGQPVGSRTLARHAGLDLSPASVRNIMADLEELGLVRSPHTSAGRVPTALGYRLFVDTLLTVSPLRASEIRKIEGELAQEHDPNQLIESVSHLLSQVTKYAGVVRIARREDAFRQLEFLALSPGRVLVILITQDAQVHNRIINTDRAYTAAELNQASNYFNETYSGRLLSGVKRALVAEMQKDSETMQRVIHAAVHMAHKALRDERGEDEGLVVSGETNLLEVPELGDVGKLRRLFEAFTTKQDLLHLLDKSMHAGGIQIFIGAEAGYESLEECSVVTSTYEINGQVVGTLGVVGPTRMAYEHVIPIVDITAKLLSGALSGENRGVPSQTS